MKIDFVFYIIYAFLKSIERGYAYQTDSKRAFLSICILALLVTLNILSILQLKLSKELWVGIWFIMLTVLYFAFVFKNRYLKIAQKFQAQWDRKLLHQVVVVCYFIFSIAYLVLNHPG